MEQHELEIVFSTEFRQEVERNLGRNAQDVALDSRVANARLVATQVKYLQRAQKKLPSYYAARAIIPSLAFEQSSSEECAAHKRFEGNVAIDLTCGLGVDTLYLAKRFRRVVAIEQNPQLAALTRHNLALLGADNVEVVCGNSEEYVASLNSADLIYADPDRRSTTGKKLVRMEDCSPNIVELLPTLRAKANHIAVKLSPLFDIREAQRIFGPEADVEVISLAGEVKEVMVYWSKDEGGGQRIATAIGEGSFASCDNRVEEHTTTVEPFAPEKYGYLVVPDAALRKASLVEEWCRAEGLDHYGPYGFSTQQPRCTMGHIYNIKVSHPYQPRKLKGLMAGKIELIRHNFPLSSVAICKALGVKEGAGAKWAFGEIDKSLWAFEVERLTEQAPIY